MQRRIWNAVVSRGDGHPTTATQFEAIGHSGPNNVAADVPSPNHIEAADLKDEEEKTNVSFLTDNHSPRRPPTPREDLKTSLDNAASTMGKSGLLNDINDLTDRTMGIAFKHEWQTRSLPLRGI
jgi:hypothetical protein